MGTLAVVELPMKSGLPKDKVTNTYAFAESGAVAGTGSLADDYVLALTRLYNEPMPALAESIGQHLAPVLSRTAGACAIKLYDITEHLDGSPHGSPYHTSTFTLDAALFAASPGLPDEVAIAVTLEASGRALQFVEVPDGVDPGAAPDRPRQRYTGRVYLGPWIETAAVRVADGNMAARPPAAFLTGLRAAVKRLADEVDVASDDNASLGVWSRANRAIRGVEFVRTDDAFDTQRRRGASPTTIARTAVAELVPEIELGA